MTLIAQINNVYIETFVTARVSLAATTNLNTIHTLARGGQFLCAIATLDHALTAAQTALQGITVKSTGGTELIVDSEITAFAVQTSNGDASARITGHKVIIFMRRKGV